MYSVLLTGNKVFEAFPTYSGSIHHNKLKLSSTKRFAWNIVIKRGWVTSLFTFFLTRKQERQKLTKNLKKAKKTSVCFLSHLSKRIVGFFSFLDTLKFRSWLIGSWSWNLSLEFHYQTEKWMKFNIKYIVKIKSYDFN